MDMQSLVGRTIAAVEFKPAVEHPHGGDSYWESETNYEGITFRFADGTTVRAVPVGFDADGIRFEEHEE